MRGSLPVGRWFEVGNAIDTGCPSWGVSLKEFPRRSSSNSKGKTVLFKTPSCGLGLRVCEDAPRPWGSWTSLPKRSFSAVFPLKGTDDVPGKRNWRFPSKLLPTFPRLTMPENVGLDESKFAKGLKKLDESVCKLLTVLQTHRSSGK